MLRRSELDSLRGAISLDPSSVPAKNETRLRDFHWKPAGKPSQEAHLEQLTLVAAPEPGKIVSLADGLKIGTNPRPVTIHIVGCILTRIVAFVPSSAAGPIAGKIQASLAYRFTSRLGSLSMR